MAVLVVILVVCDIYLLLLHSMLKLYVGTRTYDLDKVSSPPHPEIRHHSIATQIDE